MYGMQGRPRIRSLDFIPKLTGMRYAPGFMSRFGKLLHRIQERADQHTWNRDDKYMMDGLANIVVLHFRLDKLTERATKGPKL